MQHSRKQRYAALGVVTLMMMLAVLACTANDTLFIQLTLTPTPTITPTPLPFTTKFKEGDTLVVVGSGPFAQVGLANNAGPWSAAVSATVCLPNTQVTVSGVSRNITDEKDPTIYYLVTCAGKRGWLAEYQITNKTRGTKLVIKSADGSGATVYVQNDSDGRAQADKCPDGTPITVGDAQTGRKDTDTKLYLQITCGRLRGYVLETDTAPVS